MKYGADRQGRQKHPIPKKVVKIAVLKSEGNLSAVSPGDIKTRQSLLFQLHKLPDEAVLHIRNFMPQVGCPNRCSFCSQSSGKTIIKISDRGLRNLISALKTAAIEALARREGASIGSLVNDDGSLNKAFKLPEKGLIGNRLDGGESRVYPFLDTDICSYSDLYDYVKYLNEDLGVSISISTVGYSRYNKQLQRMHEKIIKEFPQAIASLAFSITPYTYGWTKAAEKSGKYSRSDFNQDMANAIKTYAPLIERLGASRKTFCVSLRFKPEVSAESRQLDEGHVKGHHFIHSGPHLLFSIARNVNLEPSEVIGVEGRIPLFNNLPQPYVLVTSDNQLNTRTWHAAVLELITKYDEGLLKGRKDMPIRTKQVYKCENEEGIYYAADPTFKEGGHFEALHFYAQTERRRVSGYNNAERTFLNTILDFKKEKGISRRDEFPDATWADVNSVVERLTKKAVAAGNYDILHRNHIEKDILPIVESYVEILKHSDLSPSFLFHPHFTDDTGQIVNRGRALAQFHGLAGKEDVPITPNEERTFGRAGHPALNGVEYRLSPNPDNGVCANSIAKRNSENPQLIKHSLILAPIDYNPMIRYNDYERAVVIEDVELVAIPFEQFYALKLLPGITLKRQISHN